MGLVTYYFASIIMIDQPRYQKIIRQSRTCTNKRHTAPTPLQILCTSAGQTLKPIHFSIPQRYFEYLPDTRPIAPRFPKLMKMMVVLLV
jgi:hypothetical protein